MGRMDILKTVKHYFLKQARYVALTNREHTIILKSSQKQLEKSDVIDIVHLFLSHVAVVLSVCSPFCSLYHGLHQFTTPMHTLFAPCPNHIADHFY